MDASWRLDRSDGLNRSLNLMEIEERQPSAPPANPVLPYNPYFTCNPTSGINNDLTLDELRALEAEEEQQALEKSAKQPGKTNK